MEFRDTVKGIPFTSNALSCPLNERITDGYPLTNVDI